MEHIDEPIGVYIRIDTDSNIIDINSDIFIDDLSDWIKIDEGYGDKYSHAQSQYLDEPLVRDDGRYTYQYVNGKVIKNIYVDFNV